MNSEKGSWTDAQRKLLFGLMHKSDLTAEDMEASLKFPMSELSVQEASSLIDCMKNTGDLSEVVKKIRDDHSNVKGPLDNVPEKPSTTPAKVQPEPSVSIPKTPDGSNAT